jgi:hypothetical protein
MQESPIKLRMRSAASAGFRTCKFIRESCDSLTRKLPLDGESVSTTKEPCGLHFGPPEQANVAVAPACFGLLAFSPDGRNRVTIDSNEMGDEMSEWSRKWLADKSCSESNPPASNYA